MSEVEEKALSRAWKDGRSSETSDSRLSGLINIVPGRASEMRRRRALGDGALLKARQSGSVILRRWCSATGRELPIVGRCLLVHAGNVVVSCFALKCAPIDDPHRQGFAGRGIAREEGRRR